MQCIINAGISCLAKLIIQKSDSCRHRPIKKSFREDARHHRQLTPLHTQSPACTRTEAHGRSMCAWVWVPLEDSGVGWDSAQTLDNRGTAASSEKMTFPSGCNQ